MNTPRPQRSKAYTLVEIMVSSSLVGIISVAVIGFFYSNYRYLFTSEQKLLINGDIRDLTNEMVENARASNLFTLYEAFYSRTRSDGVNLSRDHNGDGALNAGDRLQSGAEGEFLVFIFYEDPFFDSRLYDNDPTNDPAITAVEVNRVVAYWSAPNRRFSGETAIYTLDTDDYRTSGASSWTTPWGVTLPTTLTTSNNIESLLPSASESDATSQGFRIAVNNATGLTANGFYFENFQNRSVLARIKILHGNDAKRVTNTYNFTVTPRG